MSLIFVGVDWGSRTHSVCAVDDQGEVLGEWDFEHSGTGITETIKGLTRVANGDVSRLRVAIEIPHGAVVESLMDRGVHVYSINPKQLDRFRDRYSVAGAKDDSFDAYVLADSLRTDMRLFRHVQLSSEFIVELKDMSRLYESLTDQVLDLSNQVWAQLQRYYPQLVPLGRWHEEPWLWDLFEAAPTPKDLEVLRKSDVKKILNKNRIRRYEPLSLL